MRGIQYESMMAGSSFTSGKVPKGQVEIYHNGLLTSTFAGYGLLSNLGFLVVPVHVVKGEREIIVGRWIISVVPIYSKVHQDVMYIPLQDNVFHDLRADGVADFPPKQRTGLATCYGKNGQSSGYVRKSGSLSVLIYEGSTLPGMSGAAYTIGSKVIGMHTGSSGTHNVGVTSLLFVKELEKYKKIKPESFNPQDNLVIDGYKQRFRNSKLEWTEDDINAEIEEDNENSWARQQTDEDFWDQRLNFDRDSEDDDRGYNHDDDYDRYYDEQDREDEYYAKKQDDYRDKKTGKSMVYDASEDYYGEDAVGKMEKIHPRKLLHILKSAKAVLHEKRKTLERQKSAAVAKPTARPTATGQSPGEPGNDIISLPEHTIKIKMDRLVGDHRLLAERVGLLENKLQLVEGRLTAVSQSIPSEPTPSGSGNSDDVATKAVQIQSEKKARQEPPKNPFPCTVCKRSYRTEEGMLAHVSVVHPNIKGETAFSGDVTRSVKTRRGNAFLERRYRRQTTPPSRPNSNTKENSSLYQLILENQKSMQAFLKRLETTCEPSAKALDGQSLEESQS